MTAPKQEAREIVKSALYGIGLGFDERIQDAEFERGKDFTAKQKAEIGRHFDNYVKRLERTVWK